MQRFKSVLFDIRMSGMTHGNPTNKTISFVFSGMIGLLVGVTNGTGNRDVVNALFGHP